MVVILSTIPRVFPNYFGKVTSLELFQLFLLLQNRRLHLGSLLDNLHLLYYLVGILVTLLSLVLSYPFLRPDRLLTIENVGLVYPALHPFNVPPLSFSQQSDLGWNDFLRHGRLHFMHRRYFFFI